MIDRPDLPTGSARSTWWRGLAGAGLRAALIAVAAALLGVAVNLARPDGLPLALSADPAAHPNLITPCKAPVLATAAVRLYAEAGTAVFLDARGRRDFESGHIPGAMNLPVDEFDDLWPELLDRLRPDVPWIVYCTGPQCDDSRVVANRLHEMELPGIRCYEEGIEGWRAAGLPLEEGP